MSRVQMAWASSDEKMQLPLITMFIHASIHGNFGPPSVKIDAYLPCFGFFKGSVRI